MILRVTINCPLCQARTDVYILKGWDIADVRHECDPGGGSLKGDETFEVEYDPPRQP